MTEVFNFFPYGNNSEIEIKTLNDIFGESTCSNSKMDKIINYYFTPLIVTLTVIFLILYIPNIKGSFMSIILFGIIIAGVTFLADQYIDGWRDRNPICSPS